MDLYDGLFKLLEERTKISKQLVKAIKPAQEAKKAIEEAISNIQFPKIELSDFEIDTEEVERITKRNSSFGWTATGEIDLGIYLNENLLDLDQEEIDTLFLEHFEANSRKEYLITKHVILTSIDEKWEEVLNDSFELYEKGKYKVIIPMLISIIEGEIATVIESLEVGKPLIREFKKKMEVDKDSLSILVATSLADFLMKNMFTRKDFYEERNYSLNRNWVLHGRDNPEYWIKADALKLINLLSTIQFIKDE